MRPLRPDDFPPQFNEDRETIPLLAPHKSQPTDQIQRVRQAAFHPQLFGYSLMLFSAMCHALMSFFVHLSETHFGFPTASAILVRGLVEITAATLYLYNYVDFGSYLSGITPSMTVSLVSRGVFGSTGVICLVAALHLIPVGDAVTLFFCNPAITMALCAIFVSEPIGGSDCVSLLLCFFGVVLVSQPTFIHLPWQAATEENGASMSMTGVVLALLGAFLNASAATVTRRMGLRMHFMINGLSLSICMLLIGIGLSRTENYVQLYTNIAGTLVAVLGSMGGFCSQGFMNKGLQYCRGGPGLLIRSLSIPFSYLLGLGFLRESFSLETMFGVLLVFASSGMIALREFLKS